MPLDKYLQEIVARLNDSKLDDELVTQISYSAMILCSINESEKFVKNDSYATLLRDMIRSLIGMQRPHENVVYTNPFDAFNLVWIARYLRDMNLNSEEKVFTQSLLKLVQSDIILPNEFPLEMKLSLLMNTYSQDYVHSTFFSLYNSVLRDTSIVQKKDLFVTPDIIKNLLMYNYMFLTEIDKSVLQRWSIYLFLKKDYFSLILLGAVSKNKISKSIIQLIDDKELSIAGLFGKGALLASL